MKPIVIGKAGAKNVTLDLNVLLPTRLLVQANRLPRHRADTPTISGICARRE